MPENKLPSEIEELNELLQCEYLPWGDLAGANVFVTGGTGLVGSALIRVLLYANEKKALGLKVYALVRSVQKAQEVLGCDDALVLLPGDVEHLPHIDVPVDYVVHAASPTASKFFVEHPVETVRTAVCGTMNVFELARGKQAKSVVYLSSMEAYGDNDTDEVLTEERALLVKPLAVRNCYPQAKLMCENLCVDYYHEYGLSCKAVRLAQTFGPGVPWDDNRVFAQFARCAIEKNDIVLLTAGLTKRCYLYTLDAVSAILAVLLKGRGGEAYNAANPATYCTIREMAELVAAKIAGGEISVKIQAQDDATTGYLPAHKWNLGVDKLLQTGWRPSADMEHMYRQMIRSMEQVK